MLEILIIIGAILTFFILAFVGWLILGYNHLTSGSVDINTQWSNIKTEYQRRADLFYNLVKSVKSHKNFEKSTLTEVIAARSGAFKPGTPKGADMKKMGSLDGAFARLMLVFEQYPKLVSGEQYKELMNEIRITEDRVNVARTSYNSIVRDYNVYVRSFPSNIVAGIFSFKKEQFYLNSPSTDVAPRIDLD